MKVRKWGKGGKVRWYHFRDNVVNIGSVKEVSLNIVVGHDCCISG
jgi:hypothetical protein